MIGAITAGLYAGGVPPVTNSYESIATVTVGSGGSSSISFSSIPSTFKHLQIRSINLSSSTDNNILMTFNSDTASNYSRHYMYGDGSSVGASATTSTTALVPMTMGNSSNPMVFICDVLDYQSTSKNKTIRSLGGTDRNGSGYVTFYSGLWFKTPEAISTITLTTAAGNFNQYSSFALYGIKG